MKRSTIAAMALAAGIAIGLVAGHAGAPGPALAQSAAPGMPMHGAMQGAMPNCPAMQTMMQHARSQADRALMQSMMTMHASMQSMHLTGDADHDFMVMMIPHHQMAIAMAKVELKYGKDKRVLALAKSIIAAQQHEIDEMQEWLR